MMEPTTSVLPDVTLAMMSWRAHATLENTMASYAEAGILELFGERRIYFNEIDDVAREIAARHGFTVQGTAENLGIFGAVEALARMTTTPFMLSVENDCPLVTDRTGLSTMMRRAIDDMLRFDVPVFQMRSRRTPGQDFDRRHRYQRKFRVIWPLGAAPDARRPDTTLVRRVYENIRYARLRGSAIFAEEDPTLRHPTVIERTPNGNWLTRSPYLSWSNNSVLVRTDFLRDVILDRVRRCPAKSTINGHQDIEAALKGGDWWRRQGFRIGQSEPGPFTHHRIDR